MLKIYTSENHHHEIELDQDGQGGKLNGEPFKLDLIDIASGKKHLIFNHRSYSIEVLALDKASKQVRIGVNGKTFDLKVKERFDDLLSQLGMDAAAGKADLQVKAPMPGLVLDILVAPGDVVVKGSPMLILEAMKMENVIKSSVDAKVSKVSITKGKAVEKNEVLIEFEA